MVFRPEELIEITRAIQKDFAKYAIVIRDILVFCAIHCINPKQASIILFYHTYKKSDL